ncbi:MAG: hypothetical protein IKT09_05800 [Synergistes sp.]|nr:hypothetical protein [Synergistes sp.]
MKNLKSYVAAAFFIIMSITGIAGAAELYDTKNGKTPIYSAPDVNSTVCGTAGTGAPLINIGGPEIKKAGRSYVYILTKDGKNGWAEMSALKNGRSIKGGDLAEYVNNRFGYAIKIPRSFKSSGAAGNNDGRTFTRGAVEIIVYGSYYMMTFDWSLKDKAMETQKDFSATDVCVITDSWYLLRGKRGGKTVWEKCYYIEDGEHDITVQISYPSDREKENRAIAGMVLATLRGL